MTPAEKKLLHAEIEQFKANEANDRIYETVEETPQFPGGTECFKWINEHINIQLLQKQMAFKGELL